ncbi:MAG: aminotransferase class IV [Melioribacteraceae bacterium]
MSRLLESIKVYNKRLYNIEYHNVRMNNSRAELFNAKEQIDLSKIILVPDDLSNELYKCRIIYTVEIISVDFHKYSKKKISSLQLVRDDDIIYAHKYEDRTEIEKHLSVAKADEILIIKNGFVTDTSFSNVVFFDGIKYFTPSSHLLKGTKRAKLIADGTIQEEEIRLKDIQKFKFVHLVNALLDLKEENRIPIEKIIL